MSLKGVVLRVSLEKQFVPVSASVRRSACSGDSFHRQPASEVTRYKRPLLFLRFFRNLRLRLRLRRWRCRRLGRKLGWCCGLFSWSFGRLDARSRSRTAAAQSLLGGVIEWMAWVRCEGLFLGCEGNWCRRRWRLDTTERDATLAGGWATDAALSGRARFGRRGSLERSFRSGRPTRPASSKERQPGTNTSPGASRHPPLLGGGSAAA
jgi:hypothetical protein